MASNMTNAEAQQLGAKTLWIGDVEPWMDEQYITSLFAGVSQGNELTAIGRQCNLSQVDQGQAEGNPSGLWFR